MKKRRELDALVGNGKSRRKKSRNESGHELLRSNDSESSDGDDFHIAHAKKRETGLCSTCTTITFLLVLVCMLVCAGLIWMHLELKTDLENLKMNLKSVESKGVVNSMDILKIQGVAIQLNKTLELEMKSSKLLLENITAINGTILRLSKSLEEIGEGIKAAPEIKQIPEKLKMFSKTLVEMGSDVSTLKETVKTIDPFHKATSAKLDNLTKQIEDIKQAGAGESKSSTPPEAVSPELANIMQAIPQKLEDLNFTLSGQIAVMMKSLSLYEEKFVQLENRTSSLAKSLSEIQGAHATISDEHSAMAGGDFTSDQFKQAVTDIVQDLLPKMGTNVSEVSPVLSSNHMDDIFKNVTELLQRMNNLEKSGGSDGANGEAPDSLDSLRISLENELQAINSSLMNLRSDHNHVTSIVMDHSNSLVSIGHQVNMTLLFVHKLEQTLDLMQAETQTGSATSRGEAADQTTQSVTQSLRENGEEMPPLKSSTQTAPQDNQDNDQIALDIETTKPLSSETTTKSPEAPENVQSTDKMTQSTTESASPAINISFIKNAEDLKNGFARWSRGNAVNQVAYADLETYLGPYRPSEEALKRFDADGSGTYSLEEFSKALGIPLDDETDLPPKDQTIPPR